MTFSVDVYGHSNSDFFGHNQTHQIQKHILSDKSNAHFVNTCSPVHYIYISDVKMASPLSEKVQLCPHCNKFLSSRTVLRHRKLYGKSKRRAWRPALHVPSIGARKSLNVRLLISVYNNNCVIKLYIYDLMSSEQFL